MHGFPNRTSASIVIRSRSESWAAGICVSLRPLYTGVEPIDQGALAAGSGAVWKGPYHLGGLGVRQPSERVSREALTFVALTGASTPPRSTGSTVGRVASLQNPQFDARAESHGRGTVLPSSRLMTHSRRRHPRICCSWKGPTRRPGDRPRAY